MVCALPCTSIYHVAFKSVGALTVRIFGVNKQLVVLQISPQSNHVGVGHFAEPSNLKFPVAVNYQDSVAFLRASRSSKASQ